MTPTKPTEESKDTLLGRRQLVEFDKVVEGIYHSPTQESKIRMEILGIQLISVAS